MPSLPAFERLASVTGSLARQPEIDALRTRLADVETQLANAHTQLALERRCNAAERLETAIVDRGLLTPDACRTKGTAELLELLLDHVADLELLTDNVRAAWTKSQARVRELEAALAEQMDARAEVQ